MSVRRPGVARRMPDITLALHTGHTAREIAARHGVKITTLARAAYSANRPELARVFAHAAKAETQIPGQEEIEATP